MMSVFYEVVINVHLHIVYCEGYILLHTVMTDHSYHLSLLDVGIF